MSRQPKRLALVGILCLLPVLAGIILMRPGTAGATVAPEQTAAVDSVIGTDGGPALPPDIGAQQALTAGYYWSYAVKYVCGAQPPVSPTVQGAGETTVKPGNYATEINIHNPNYRQNPIKKKIIVLVDAEKSFISREPQTTGPRAYANVFLAPDFATMDDCNALWAMFNPSGALTTTPMQLLIGYLVIISPLPLDVDAVYTAAVPGTMGSQPTGISIDVNRVPGDRVYIPVNMIP